MKKIISICLAAVLALALFALPVFASKPGYRVYVTIADENGEIVLASVELWIERNDLTLDDVLRIAHEEFFDGENGYVSEATEWGRSMVKLWGVENGGSYGYYINNASPSSLLDTVKHGDHIYAFVYTDTLGFSDTYSYFDSNILYNLERGDEVTLTLMQAGYDENWNPVSTPLAGAIITVNGKATDFVTDVNGKVTLTLDDAGALCISAEKEGMNLVPPVCVANVEGLSNVMIYTMLGAVAFIIVIAICVAFAVVIYTRKISGKEKNEA